MNITVSYMVDRCISQISSGIALVYFHRRRRCSRHSNQFTWTTICCWFFLPSERAKKQNEISNIIRQLWPLWLMLHFKGFLYIHILILFNRYVLFCTVFPLVLFARLFYFYFGAHVVHWCSSYLLIYVRVYVGFVHWRQGPIDPCAYTTVWIFMDLICATAQWN